MVHVPGPHKEVPVGPSFHLFTPIHATWLLEETRLSNKAYIHGATFVVPAQIHAWVAGVATFTGLRQTTGVRLGKRIWSYFTCMLIVRTEIKNLAGTDPVCPTVVSYCCFPVAQPAASERSTRGGRNNSSACCGVCARVHPPVEDSGNIIESRAGGWWRASSRALTTGRRCADMSDVIDQERTNTRTRALPTHSSVRCDVWDLLWTCLWVQNVLFAERSPLGRCWD